MNKTWTLLFLLLVCGCKNSNYDYSDDHIKLMKIEAEATQEIDVPKQYPKKGYHRWKIYNFYYDGKWPTVQCHFSKSDDIIIWFYDSRVKVFDDAEYDHMYMEGIYNGSWSNVLIHIFNEDRTKDTKTNIHAMN